MTPRLRCVALRLAALCAVLPAVCGADVSSLLQQLSFLHSGTATAQANYSRLLQCSSFSECTDAWKCGSPRDYLWDASAGATPQTVAAPPMGLRSAVPLGGLGAGTFELRGDGSFADWMIEGQGTALAANAVQNSKLPLKAEALLAVFAQAAGGSPLFAATLRTTPRLACRGWRR